MSKKITLDKTDLHELLSATAKFFPKKSSLPILECYKIDVTPSAFKVTVNNLDAAIERSLPIMGMDTFEACVDKTILEMVSKCPKGDIVLEFMENKSLKIIAGKAVFQTQTQSTEQYPHLPETKEKEKVSLVAKDLTQMLKDVEFATSDDGQNKMLMAVNLSLKDGILKLTALDGHRIAVQSKEVKVDKTVSAALNIPPMSRYIQSMDSEDDVIVSWDDNHIILSSLDCKIVCRLIDGEYFKTDQMLSADTSIDCDIDREEFLSSLERASLLVKAGSDGAKRPVVLQIEDDIMRIMVEDTKGFFEETILMKKKSGRNIRIGFNVKFLIESLKVIKDSTIKLLFDRTKSPLIIKKEQEEGNGEYYTHLILPVNLPK